MGEHSSIEWTNASWNAVVGCSMVSRGCEHCYAATYDKRFRLAQEHTPYKPWTHPNAKYNVRVFPDRLSLPRRWKPSMVFVNSRSDMFHEEIPPAFRNEMWQVMKETPQHTYQILTKRPENISTMLPADWGQGYPNVWLGVSGETIDLAFKRGMYLWQVKAKVHFLSAEPWLESVVPDRPFDWWFSIQGYEWVIIGGESGPNARPMNIESAKALKDACMLGEIPVFVKQLGGTRDKRSHDKAVLDGKTWKEFPT